MAAKVKLSELIFGMEIQSEEASAYFHKITGEVFVIEDRFLYLAEADDDDDDDDDYSFRPSWEEKELERAREIVETDDYLKLPTRWNVHEYNMMEGFIRTLEDNKIAGILATTIHGSGAFRRFKDSVYQFDLEKRWYEFRDEAYKEIARSWCREQGILYIED